MSTRYLVDPELLPALDHIPNLQFTTESLGHIRAMMKQPGSPGISPYAAAARAENLAGLPPAFICVASLDLLLEEDLEYARRLMRAGVPTELHVYPRTYHGFVASPNSQVAQAGMRDLLAALKRALVG